MTSHVLKSTMPTNLSTLKAMVRDVLRDCVLPAGENTPEFVRAVAEGKKDALLMSERLITNIAIMMQRHEEETARRFHQKYLPQQR